jgi:hypothetical protein
VVKVEEGEVDGDGKNKINKKAYDVEVIIVFHGRWSWNFSKMQKKRKDFCPYNLIQFIFI